MKTPMIYLMNSPVLTRYGLWQFSPLSVEAARHLLQTTAFTSAIGHDSTAELLSHLLDMPIAANRIQVELGSGDQAVVFRIKTRLPEGQILTAGEMANIPYELARLDWLGEA